MTLVIGALVFWIAAWWINQKLVTIDTGGNDVLARCIDLAVPLLFGVTLLVLWEGITRGLEVPKVLLPPPSAIGERIVNSLPILWVDFQQTFLKAVLAGYIIGCGSGFLVALAIDRSPFLQRGLLPLGNFVSALPIIGVAPIMVMWFGFDWHSKAAVVVIMTFFPMLVNTVQGLGRRRADGARPDAHLCEQLVAGPRQAAVANGRPLYFQCSQSQFHVGADRCHRGRVLRHAYRRHGLSHLYRGRTHEC